MASAPSSVMEDDDVEVTRIPVFLRPSAPAERAVCIFQYPLRPRWRPYNLNQLQSARARPQQRSVELTLGMECGPNNHDDDSPSPLTQISLASTTTSAKTSYAIGMLRSDQDGKPVSLCLTPLDEAVQLRPSFVAIDDAESSGRATGISARAGGDDDEADEAAEGDEGEEGDEEEEEASGGATVAPHFKPAQTEREIEARRSSHAYLVEQRESEPWSVATLYAADSPESIGVREGCFRAPIESLPQLRAAPPDISY